MASAAVKELLASDVSVGSASAQSSAPTAVAKDNTPSAAADEWIEAYSEKHKRKYWKNKVTGKTSWTAPEKSPAAAGVAAETKGATEQLAKQKPKQAHKWH